MTVLEKIKSMNKDEMLNFLIDFIEVEQLNGFFCASGVCPYYGTEKCENCPSLVTDEMVLEKWLASDESNI